MKILCLYNNDCAVELFNWLSNEGHEIEFRSDKLSFTWCREQRFDLTISYTYRYILSAEIIHSLNNNVVNLHNSFLPFNRGADPNLWSIVDKTPRGVTLHYIDGEIDKGYIISQSIVADDDNETLSSSYDNLDRAAKQLFKDAFCYYKFWPKLRKKAIGSGTYHTSKDADRIKSVIDSYDLSVKEFRERLRRLERMES